MARQAKELSAIEVSRLCFTGHHAIGGVTGLYLYVKSSTVRSWVLRLTVGNKRRHIGLGGYPSVTLAQAREQARNFRLDVQKGVDPILQRRAINSQLRAQQSTAIAFEKAAQGYMDTHGDSWRNLKHRAQWTSTLSTYVYPVIGKMLVADIEVAHVLSVLNPIWKTKNETANRVRGRIESILNWALARGYRAGENPAKWKGLLDNLLPAPSKVSTVTHHKAMPIDEVPDFISRLRMQLGNGAMALDFAILCASRSGEVRGAEWNEFDLENRVWTIPKERMKAGKEHRVPLSPGAMEILMVLHKPKISGIVFRAPKGGMMSDMTLTAVMRRMKVDAVPHGFRSTFRDWIWERTDHSRDLAEQALAHTLENKVEAAYRRGDALERRRQLMEDWGTFVSSAN